MGGGGINKNELLAGTALAGLGLATGGFGLLGAPALMGADAAATGGAAALGAGAAATGAAGAAPLIGGGTSALFGAAVPEAAGGLGAALSAPAATDSLAGIGGSLANGALDAGGLAPGVGMGGGTESLFGAGQLPSDQVGQSMMGRFNQFMGKVGPVMKGINAGNQAAKLINGEQPQMQTLQKPPSMTQPQSNITSADIMAQGGNTLGSIPGLPGAPGQPDLPPDILAMLKARGIIK